MIRYVVCLAAILLAGSSLWAGELDKEFGAKKGPVGSVDALQATQPLPPFGVQTGVARASELDEESPTQAHRRGWRGGWHGGWGGGWYGGYRGWYGGYRTSFGVGWGGYAWPRYHSYYYGPTYSYSYYPSYGGYGYYGYPGWNYCW